MGGLRPARRGLGGAKPRVVRRCNHTCQTIRWVDRLSPSTLFFSGKFTPLGCAVLQAGARRAPWVVHAGKITVPTVHGKKIAPTPIKGCSFWSRGSENHTFWAVFALKMQLLLVAPSPNYTVQLIWVRPCFMWNGIPLAPREHTPALTLGASQLTLVGALARKPLGQSSSNSLCKRVL